MLSLAMVAAALTYHGDARVIDLASGRESRQEFIVAKTVDQARGEIVEIACTKSDGAAARVSPVYMKVRGDRIVAMSDRPTYDGALTGTGTLQGPAWAWTYLTFSMRFDMGASGMIRIEDGNWVTPDALIARKQIFRNDVPVQLWETEARLVSADDFAAHAARLDCGPMDLVR